MYSTISVDCHIYPDGDDALAENLQVQRVPRHHQFPCNVVDLPIRLDPLSLDIHDVLLSLITDPTSLPNQLARITGIFQLPCA